MLSNGPHGLVLICNLSGEVEDVLSDAVGLPMAACPGVRFVSMLSPGCLSKGMNLLREIQSRGVAFDWELDLESDSGAVDLYFQGLRRDNRLFLIGSVTRSEFLDLQYELTNMSSKNVTALRSALRDLQAERARAESGGPGLSNQLSRLNGELAAAQRELVRTNAELERLNSEKTRFLGMAAHELRMPLGAITTYADFLEEDAGSMLSEVQHEFLSVIQESSRMMLTQIDEFLELAAVESGPLHLRRELSRLEPMLAHTVVINRTLASRKSIRIELEVQGEPPELSVDLPKIEQVLNNLIGNAIKLSPPRQTITVGLRCQGDEVIISVTDHGLGMSATELDCTFGPPSDGVWGGMASEAATGLGLAICRQIVDAHGGRVWAESQIGLGSTFYVALRYARTGSPEDRMAVGQTSRSSAMPY